MRPHRDVVGPAGAQTESKDDDLPIRLSWRRIAAEDQLLAILAAPRAEGEQFDAEFRRKEHQLGNVFASLSAIESLGLQRRLALRLPDDELAARFARLTSDRRERLTAFLMAARRRFAVLPRVGRDG